MPLAAAEQEVKLYERDRGTAPVGAARSAPDAPRPALLQAKQAMRLSGDRKQVG